MFPDDSRFFQLIRIVTTSALRTPEERLPSNSPEEFGRMIFENKSSLRIGDRTKIQSTLSAAARGGEARRWDVR